jgi:peroxiredoxin
MLPLGTPAPEFALQDVLSGESITLDRYRSRKGLLVMFICAHCPYVHHVSPELARLGADFAGSGLGMVAISSNDIAQYPDDAPEPTARYARASGWTFPVLFDPTQEVAKAYTAACTPDFFLFGPDLKLVYRGQIDDSRPNRGGALNTKPLDGHDMRNAIAAVLAGAPVDAGQKASIGCNIKWKAGNEPVYFGGH